MIGLGPDFTKLWLAQAVSNVGDGVYVTALPLVAASLIRDPLSVSAVWRLETFKFSTDPGLEAKVRDVVGLYLDPQERAIVVCGDEKSQIQDVPDDEHESPKQLKRWTSRVQDRAREHRSAQLHAPFAAVTAAWLIESDLDADARRPGEDAATRRTSQERRRPGRVAAVEGQLAGLVVAADQQPVVARLAVRSTAVVVVVEAEERVIRVELAALGQLRGESTQTDSNSDDGIVPTGILVDHGA